MSKNSIEEKISSYIDALNKEQEPEILQTCDDRELEKLISTVHQVRSLREASLPEEGYSKGLAQIVANKLQSKKESKLKKQKAASKSSRWAFMPVAALAASLLLFILTNWLGLFNQDVVYAMEKAVGQLSSYHGVLEMRTKNADGEEWLVRQVEIWTEGDKYAIKQADGTLTVNNGQQKWQLNPQEKELVLLPLLPDPTGNSFDLRDEAKRARQYPHTIVGSELIAAREAVKLAIAPPGGEEYYLWVDAETNLPIRLQTAMQNGLQTTYTFVSFKPNLEIDPEIFAYQVPQGYKVIEDNPGQLVTTIEEAAAISGFSPLVPEQGPGRILAFPEKIVLDYGDTTIVEAKAEGDFELAPNASLGTAAGGPLEIWYDRLRWRQGGLEIQVEGAKGLELASQLAGDLTVPGTDEELASKAQVKLPVDLEAVEAAQKQVDRGSSPWQLDPLHVSLTFVNLKVTPEGIQGEPEIDLPSFKLVHNNSVEAVVEVSNGPIKRVYLKRLVRQDETGIWTVVGYDPS